MQPIISVIVPVYNTEQYLPECLASVAGQSFTDWECIVIDDGSKSPELINAIAASVLKHRGTVIHQQNRGVSAARNKGITASNGSLIVCLDSDDYLHPQFLSKTASAMQANPDADIITCWTQQIGRKENIMKPFPLNIFWLLQRNLLTVSALFKKNIWRAIGGFDERMLLGHEDWEFWIRAGLSEFKFYCVPETLFYYRIHDGSRNDAATINRVNTIRYIRHKYPAIYFMPLTALLSYPAFKNISKQSLFRFWMTGLFFHYLPLPLQRALFTAYQNVFKCRTR
jgi:hypothetical protein